MLCFWLLLLTFVVGRKEGRKETTKSRRSTVRTKYRGQDRTKCTYSNYMVACICVHWGLMFYIQIYMNVYLYVHVTMFDIPQEAIKGSILFQTQTLRIHSGGVRVWGAEELAALTHCWCEINTGQRQRRGKEKRNLKKLTKEKKAIQKHGQKTTKTKLELHKKKFLPVFLWQKHRNCGYVHVINDAATQLKERPKSPATPHRRQQQQHELILFTDCKQYSRRWEKRCVKSWNCSPTKTSRGVESRKGQTTTTTIPPKHQQHPPTKQLRKVFQGTSAEYPDTKTKHIHSLTQ